MCVCARACFCVCVKAAAPCVPVGWKYLFFLFGITQGIWPLCDPTVFRRALSSSSPPSPLLHFLLHCCFVGILRSPSFPCLLIPPLCLWFSPCLSLRHGPSPLLYSVFLWALPLFHFLLFPHFLFSFLFPSLFISVPHFFPSFSNIPPPYCFSPPPLSSLSPRSPLLFSTNFFLPLSVFFHSFFCVLLSFSPLQTHIFFLFSCPLNIIILSPLLGP